ncbi:unnamed protein product [Parnassius apollo]|uniref:(apollo) hypothetical protein n=1 Tax=Parnassius apollo TaxID=110799 RepID=A0A8S3XDZ5_PARAO|nr:unnamed protein product [Parnassius apollo]
MGKPSFDKLFQNMRRPVRAHWRTILQFFESQWSRRPAANTGLRLRRNDLIGRCDRWPLAARCAHCE